MKFIPILAGLLIITSASAKTLYDSGRHTLDFHGYLRTGDGWSESGQGQEAFRAPGARAKYRLGNEADHNGKVIFSHRYKTGKAQSGPVVHSYIMYDGTAPHGTAINFDGITQLYIALEGLSGGDASVWAGRRWYDRKSIFLTDHFWLNTAQGADFGFGFEGVGMAGGELAIAALRYRDDNKSGSLDGVLKSSAVDIRLRNLPLSSEHKLSLWGLVSKRHANSSLGYDEASGVGAGGWIDSPEFWGGEHVLSFIYTSGSAITQNDFNTRPVREDQGWDLSDAEAFELNSNYHLNFKAFALQSMLLYRYESRARDGVHGDNLSWLSAGGQLIHFVSDHFSIAYEFGVDWTDSEITGLQGSLRKTTVALQLAKKPGYYERPALRLFVTGAQWSDDFKGSVASSAYAYDTHGFSMGIQFETWW